MKTVGLITEYNPFHNGHAYHIKKARELTGADTVIVVMSGDFVQRGTPAIMPKHLRATCALLAGASLVIELPVCFATGSAEYFAWGAVSLLHELGCIDSICFGSECGHVQILDEIAQILLSEPPAYSDALKDALKKGCSYPAARQQALSIYSDQYKEVLASPNNILGIEYLKALHKLQSNIKAFSIKRIGAGYHDTDSSQSLSSATAIRTDIHNMEMLRNQMPAVCFEFLQDSYQTRYPIIPDDFSLLLKARLLTETSESLCRYMDVSPDLANRIIHMRNDYMNMEQFCDLLKTKELTRSRISRSLMHILLGITHDWHHSMQSSVPYARILGFRKDRAEIFRKLKSSSSIPLITRPAQAELNASAQEMLALDLYASDLYESVITDKYGSAFRNERTKQIIKI